MLRKYCCINTRIAHFDGSFLEKLKLFLELINFAKFVREFEKSMKKLPKK